MLEFVVDGNSTTVKATGTHRDMLAEAMSLAAQLQRFVFRLGYVEYLTFVIEMEKIIKSDDFFDFLRRNPDEETRIAMPYFNQGGESDDE